MTNRRSHRRFLLPDSTGEIRVLHDVVLESMEAGIVSVIARAPSVEGEEISLHISGRSGCAQSLTVRTLESTPVLVDDSVRHRVRLAIVRSVTCPGPLSAAAAQTWANDQVIACVLLRRATARVLDVSARGCLLETSVTVPLGASALLDIEIEGKRYIEMIRVCRAMSIPGTTAHSRVGAEFLPTFEAASRSIRPLVAHLEVRHSGLVFGRRESSPTLGG